MREELYSVLDDDGNVLHKEREPEIPEGDLLRLYRGMLQVRIVDDRMMKLQRTGKIGFYM